MNTGKVVDLTQFYVGSYLSGDGLKAIVEWPISGLGVLIDHIYPVWMYNDCGYWSKKQNGIYRIATGGWSGNEDIIDALGECCHGIWWHQWWLRSERGGLYLFQNPEDYRRIHFPNAKG